MYIFIKKNLWSSIIIFLSPIRKLRLRDAIAHPELPRE